MPFGKSETCAFPLCENDDHGISRENQECRRDEMTSTMPVMLRGGVARRAQRKDVKFLLHQIMRGESNQNT